MKKRNRKLCAVLLVLSMALTVMGTVRMNVPARAANKNRITGIRMVNPASSVLTMQRGGTFQLKTECSPKSVKNVKVKYRSGKPSVASVSADGVIRAKKTGTARITAFAANQSAKRVSVKVTVVKKLKKVSRVTLNVRTVNLYLNGDAGQKSYKLAARTAPGNATVKKVIFQSSNKAVATVSQKGMIRAKKEGQATITAYAADGWGKKAACKVVVGSRPAQTAMQQTDRPAGSGSETPKPTPEQPAIEVPSPAPTVDKSFELASANHSAQIFLDEKGADYEGLKLVANCFAEDVKLVADAEPDIVTDESELTGTPVIAGSIGNNEIISRLAVEGKLDLSPIEGKWETYRMAVVENPLEGIERALVIAGSDKRGTMYGIFHLSELMGVSPWVYWADVNPEKQDTVSFLYSQINIVSKEPSVKYRGIFLNDEEPSLGTWVNNFFKEAKGGKFNEKFYEKVFQLILRLKGNYLWPAMWNSAFGDDGFESTNASAELADTYGIVMGTSHHEPMMRAHQEWVRNKKNYGNGTWDFVGNRDGLIQFFEEGAVKNGAYDNIATLGMRGDGDAPMLPDGSSLEENISLLKEIITEQKNILQENGLENKPTMLALYKEVEDYWQGGDGAVGLKDWDGLDGVTVLLSDDNYGNVRSLPTDENKDRPGGWGMYYHFDYNGAPSSYQWVQTMQLQKIWEQMSMAYDYGVKDIWIVNVGDLKPMEMPISYFMDMAWDFDRWGTSNVSSAQQFQEAWMNEQFGSYTDPSGIEEISSIVSKYLSLNGSRKPEIVKGSTYSLANYNEAVSVLQDIDDIMQLAEKYKQSLPEEAQASYYQLVYYPAVASANIHRMQIYAGMNKAYVRQKRAVANVYAALASQAIDFDQELEKTYNKNMPGGVGDKWDGMMSQARNAAHVGYDTWKPQGSYPKPEYIEVPDGSRMLVGVRGQNQVYESGTMSVPQFINTCPGTRTIDIENGGKDAFSYTVEADQSWIGVTKTSGEVTERDSVEISVDYSQLNEDSYGTVCIKGNGQEVVLGVSAAIMNISSRDPMTFMETDGYISIEAEHYADAKPGKDQSEWKVIPGYGRGLSSLKVFPTTAKFSDASDAPYVEYKVFAYGDEDYNMDTYFAPSNPVDADNISMKFGVSVDGGDIQQIDVITNSYTAGAWSDSTWSKGVQNNVHTITAELGNLAWGEHTIRIYALDPALVLQKIVLYPDRKMPASYFGPPESYYTGK